MQRFEKWWTKYKDTIPGIIIFIVLTWLVSKFLDWISNEIGKNPHFFSNALSYRINIPIFAIVTAVILVLCMWRIYKRQVLSKRKLVVLDAQYGNDGRYFNITSELNNKVIKDNLKIIIDNNIAGDPAYGVFKVGIIKYKFDGKEHTVKINEGDLLDIP